MGESFDENHLLAASSRINRGLRPDFRYTLGVPRWGVSSIGRALPLQGRGYRFEPGTLHEHGPLPTPAAGFSLPEPAIRTGSPYGARTMPILCPTTDGCDYLQDQVVIGLRELYGDDAIEIPRKDILYRNSATPKKELYGHGFSVWCTLEDTPIDRSRMIERAVAGEFDTIVFPSIWRNEVAFRELRAHGVLDRPDIRVVFVDGEDHPRLYRDALGLGPYFKRELRRRLTVPRGVHGIGFAIPKSKLRAEPLEKTRTFATHAQCLEAYKLPEVREQCRERYAFDEESDYYDDIATSQYAFTMKKAGWECMRHYEIAASHTVPCFHRLNARPKHCAPHGLVDLHNAVAFRTARELETKLAHIRTEGLYPTLQANAYAWACEHTCDRMVRRLLD